MINTNETNAERKTLYDMRNKIVLVGLANAGKTSIYIRCFENADHVRIRNLTPTILFTSNKPQITFTEEFIEFVDLGGQKQYIKHHLADPSQFRNLRTVIFVVDVQKASKLREIKQYFSNVLQKIRDNNENPIMTVFLHKVDPNLKPGLQENVVTFVKELRPLFPSNIVFHATSVFDDTLYEAMVQTLFTSLPKSVIHQSITKDVLYTAHKTLLPIFKGLHGTTSDESKLKPDTLLAFAIPFGNALGKKLKDKWIRYIANSPDSLDDTPSMEEKIEILPESEESILIETKCPVLAEDAGVELHPFYCEITKGILEGLGKLIGLDCVIQIQTQILDNTSLCKFQLQRTIPRQL
ncbi:MAG: ADP-ribosylation factor-like protein [Candidatus Hodarchaeota archaeon]